MKKSVLIFFFIGILLLMNGCSFIDRMLQFGAIKESIEEPVYIPLYGDFTINPMRNHNLSYHHFSHFVFDGLFTISENGEPIPSVVESYSFDNIGQRLHLKLHKDVLWHDGERLTTEDVAFTVAVHHYALLNLKDEERSEFIPFAGEIQSVEVFDELNCDLVFHSPSSFRLSRLSFPLLPAHVYQGEGTERFRHALSSEYFVPIGCGSYKWVSDYPEIQLEKFRYYRDSSHQLKKINGRIISSEDQVLTMMEEKKINFAELFELNIDKYKKNGIIKSVDFVSCEYELLMFNYDNPNFLGDSGRRIRKIIGSLIPKKEIIREVMFRKAVASDVPVSPESYLFSREKKDMMSKKDIVQTLEQLGYQKNEEGLLMNGKGEMLKFRMLFEDDPIRRAAASLIVSSFRNAGIILETIFLDQNSDEWKKTLDAGRYDIAWLVFMINEDHDLSEFFDVQSSLYARMATPEEQQMSSLWQRINVEWDPKQKVLYYKKLQEMIRKEIPHVGLFFRKKTLFSSKDVLGDSLPDMFQPYRGISKLIYSN